MLFSIICGCMYLSNVVLVATAKSTNWAVLVAGSNGYFNYRHQADVAHAYQILTKLGGFPKDNVIVMMYDDIAHSSANPFPGQLFNEPGGDDVYADIQIDYSGDNVTANTFLNVIQGIKANATSNGPVLESGKKDKVFIYYSDHGASGLIGMPTGDPLYADDLNKALEYMHKHKMYSQLVFYLEACQSGSMFEKILSPKHSVFATTAATPSQSSFAYYWNDTLSTYMADEYSIRWMQDTTVNWAAVNPETLWDQFQNVSNAVKESQPQQYGDDSFDDEPISDFESFGNSSSKYPQIMDLLKTMKNSVNVMDYDEIWATAPLSVSSRDVKLAVLQNRYLAEKDEKMKEYRATLVKQEIEYRMGIDAMFEELIQRVVSYVNAPLYWNEEMLFTVKYGYVDPLDWTCLKYTYYQYEKYCERFNDYSLQFVRVLVNLCEMYHDAQVIEYSVQEMCK